MVQKQFLSEGKAKIIYATDDPECVIIHYSDDMAAYDGIKKARIANKGKINNRICEIIYAKLNQEGIPTHFIQRLTDSDQLCKKVTIIPLQFIVRNVIAGSMTRLVGIPEGTHPEKAIFEINYKDFDLGYPLINDSYAIALHAATEEELKKMYEMTDRINQILIGIFSEIGIELVDFKLEFGKTDKGEIILADEITPDTCRLWDIRTKQRLDKDRFRLDLGDVRKAYQEVLNRLEAR